MLLHPHPTTSDAVAQHSSQIAEQFAKLIGGVVALYGIGRGCFMVVRRTVRRAAARDHALRIILDVKRQQLAPETAELDVDELRFRSAQWFDAISKARDRLWLAYGHKRSAPSRAPSADETDEDT